MILYPMRAIASRRASGPAAFTGILSDSEDTGQSTTSTSYADISCETAATTNGVDYLVLWNASQGANTSSRRGYVQCVMGGTQIGECGGESSLISTSTLFCGPPGCQVNVVTGNGSTIKLQGKTNAGTTFFGAMSIVAIPLTSLTSGTHYHSSCTTATTEVVSDAGTATWSDVLSVSWDFGGSAADWLIFGSFETDYDAFTASRTTGTKMVIDATDPDPNTPLNCEGENAADICNWMWVEKASLSGTKTIKLQVISGGTAEVDARRPNLFALKVSALAQVVSVTQSPSTRYTTTSSTYVDVNSGLDLAITPTVASAPITFVYATSVRNSGGSGGNPVTQVYNTTDSAAHQVNACNGINNASDDIPKLHFYHATRSAATTVKLQFSAVTGSTNTSIPSNNNEQINGFAIEWVKP